MKKQLLIERASAGLFALVLLVSFSVGGALLPVASAASLTGLSDTMSSSKVSATSTHALRFTSPTGAQNSTSTIIVTFPSDFNFTSKTIGTLTFTHGASTGAENTETLAASPSTSAWGAVFSGTQNRILTLTAPTDGIGSAALAPTQKVILSYDSTNSINPSTPSNYAIAISGTFGDTGTITVPILTNDQVAVSATVTQSLTFTLSTTTIGFSNLSSGASTYATGNGAGSASETEAYNFVASTNASSGYTVTVQGATLTDSSARTITAIGGTNTAPAPGTEQFGLRINVTGSGTGTSTSPYAAAGFAYAANATTTSQVASASAATLSNTFSARLLANISPLTEAGDYSTALTHAATANF